MKIDTQNKRMAYFYVYFVMAVGVSGRRGDASRRVGGRSLTVARLTALREGRWQAEPLHPPPPLPHPLPHPFPSPDPYEPSTGLMV